MKATISVLMSVYRNDVSEFVDIAIKSIWTDQIHKPDEIIIVVDGLVDDSIMNVLDAWSYKLKDKLKLVYNEKNMGLGYSLNKGLQYCISDYIARMDSDDISLPNRFLLQYNYILSNQEVDVLGGAIEEFTNNSSVSYLQYFPKDTQLIKNYLPKGTPFAHPTVVIKRDVLLKNRYKENLNVFKKDVVSSNEDIDLWFRLALLNYEMANLNDVILRFRKNENYFKKRNINQAIMEFSLFWKGTYNLFGVSYMLIYPLLRFFVRLLPMKFMSYVYSKRYLLNERF